MEKRDLHVKSKLSATLNEKMLQKGINLSELIFITSFHNRMRWWNLTKQLTEKLNNDEK